MEGKQQQPDLTLDKPSEQGFVSFFNSLGDSNHNENGETPSIRIFERNGGDFYSCHGEDAHLVANEVFKTTNVIKMLGSSSNPLPTCTLTKLTAANFIKHALFNLGYKIEIWSQNQNGKTSSFSISKRASPGNLSQVEDILGDVIDSTSVVLALKWTTQADRIIVGVAFLDASSNREINVTEFDDSESLDNLEVLLVQVSVKECILSEEKSIICERVTKILKRCGIVITYSRKQEFSTRDLEQDANRLLPDNVNISTLPEYDLKVSMSSLGALIKYLGILSDETNHHKYSLKQYDFGHFMRLDSSAIKALNLMPETKGAKTTSLFGVLNRCKTVQGSRLLERWLRQPLLNVEEIAERQDIVEALINDTLTRQIVRDDVLKGVPDIHRLHKKFVRGSALLQDVIRLYQLTLLLPSLKEALDGCNEHPILMKKVFGDAVDKSISELSKFQQMVETTIDLDAVARHEYIVKADFDEELQVCRAQINHLLEKMENLAYKSAGDLHVEFEKKLKLEQTPQYGYCMKLPRKESSVLRGNKHYMELQTKKDGVYFTTSDMKKTSSEHSELNRQYSKIQQKLVTEVLDITATYFPVLEPLNDVIAKLDVLSSFAQAALIPSSAYVRPKITAMNTGDLILKGSRHPCLELQDMHFIDNDIEMIRDKSTFQLITGPNMGGKSTYIRQTAMIVLMAQCGSFVPCSSASIPVFDAIMARIGAGDSQIKGVSTFMAEMLDTATILRSGTANSLVVIDELGRGTSTYDGFGLAYAISEYIATKIQAFTLFATHFHELTTLEHRIPKVRNLHVTAQCTDAEITLLYKVRDGPCDQSFGIRVAELANFPENVVKLSKRKADELEDFVSESNDVELPYFLQNGQVNSKKSNQEKTANPKKLWKSNDESIGKGMELINKYLEEYNEGVKNGKENEEVGLQLKNKYCNEFEQNEFIREVLTEL